jgi:NAD(P)-dependent dehydrogenase (short-subunit alcohol dehydrogenase family)
MKMKLKNETAIITGSTTGIGRMIAELLLREGCKVTICSRSKDKVEKTVAELKKDFGESVIGAPCDVNIPSDLKNIVDITVKKFGSARILIANAGINSVYGPFECLDPKNVSSYAKEIINTNLVGVMNSIAAVLPQMNSQKYGRIITLSGGGVDRPIDNMTLYSASKAGIVTFSKCFAVELAQKEEDIKINIFHPGIIRTELMTSFTCVPNWKTEEETQAELDMVLSYIGGDVEKRSKVVLSYVTPETKTNGKVFRGFSLPVMIFNAIRLNRAIKKIRREEEKLKNQKN